MKRRQIEEKAQQLSSHPSESLQSSSQQQSSQQRAQVDALNTSVDSAASGTDRYHTPTGAGGNTSLLTPAEREAAELVQRMGNASMGKQNEEEDWAKAWSDDEESDGEDGGEGDAGKPALPLTKEFRDGAAAEGGVQQTVGQTSSLPPVPAVAQHAGFVPVRPAPDLSQSLGGQGVGQGGAKEQVPVSCFVPCLAE